MTKTFLLPILFAAALLLAPEKADAQVCQYVPHGGGESITAQVTVKDTGQAVGNGSVVAAGTNLQFDVVATAFGRHTHRRERLRREDRPPHRPAAQVGGGRRG